MRFSQFLLTVLPALVARATPLQEWASSCDTGGNVTNDNDLNYLNAALSVANLQNAFYKQNLANLDDSAFNSSGYSTDVRNNFEQISQEKQAQVNVIAQTLGQCATPYCNYDFHVTNASNFTATSQVIENIGTAAYIGSIGNITNSTLQTWAASILSSNARAASYAATVNGAQPVNGPFDTPLSPQEVATISSQYVTSCPNSTDIFQPGHNLTISQVSANEAQFTFNNSSTNGEQLYAVFHQGLSKTIVPINNGVATIPANTTGIVFAEVTNSSTVADDNTIVAGPNFLNIPVPNGSNGTVPASGPVTTIASSAATMTPTASSSAPESSSSAEPTSSSEAASSSAAPASSSAESSSASETTTATETSSTEQSTVVVTTTSQESTVVVTATSQESTVVVTATA